MTNGSILYGLGRYIVNPHVFQWRNFPQKKILLATSYHVIVPNLMEFYVADGFRYKVNGFLCWMLLGGLKRRKFFLHWSWAHTQSKGLVQWINSFFILSFPTIQIHKLVDFGKPIQRFIEQITYLNIPRLSFQRRISCWLRYSCAYVPLLTLSVRLNIWIVRLRLLS